MSGFKKGDIVILKNDSIVGMWLRYDTFYVVKEDNDGKMMAIFRLYDNSSNGQLYLTERFDKVNIKDLTDLEKALYAIPE